MNKTTVRNASAMLFIASMIAGSKSPAGAFDFCWTNDIPCGGDDEGECLDDCESRAQIDCWGLCEQECHVGATFTGTYFIDGSCETPPHQAEFRCQCS
jgi:hypothetical protein